MKKILEVIKVNKSYKIYKNNLDRLKEIFTNKECHREFIANKNINFNLNQGETLGIIGVNGAGKSTLLKIIAGVITPTSGEIIRRGRVTALLELGTGFNNEMTGRENISLNGELIGMRKSEINSEIKNIIDFSELGGHIEQPLRTYSSGMKMRLAFSIAIHSDPKILIVDEALSVGDAHFSAKCTKALEVRKKKKMSIIYVSHDLNSLKILCDRVIMLNHGEIISSGEPEDIINSYNLYIAKLNEEQTNITIDTQKRSSFGDFDIEIKEVTIKGEISNSQTLISGENANIELAIEANKSRENMTVGIIIRDKFGQDIFGTNSYHHNIEINFEAKKTYRCNFKMPMNIGHGKYSITAAVHSEHNHLDNCSHWLDHAANFEVSAAQGEQFIGLCKLEPIISITMQS